MSQPPAPPAGMVRDGTVLALDNVPLDLPLAGAGSRVLAAFIDYLLVGVLATGWIVVCLVASAAWFATRNGWGVAIALLGLFLLDWCYFAGMELSLGGRTVGKRVVGLRVVSRAGGSPSVAALLLRNLLRSADVVVGVPLMSLDPLSRRLGDRVAGTLVVHDRPGESELVLARVPAGWGAREVATAEALLVRASGMDPARANALAARMLELIERRDPVFLTGVERDGDALATLRRAFSLGRP